MNSEQRKRTIQAILKRGQLKQLSSDLKMSYSYLSQAFSPATAINFTSELARKVEKSLGIAEGQLDQGEQLRVQKRNPIGLLAVALIGREAQLSNLYPDKRVEKNATVAFDDEIKRVDLIVYNKDGSVFLIAEQSSQFDAHGGADQLIMLMAISGAEYGVVFAPDSGANSEDNEYGFSLDYKKSRWYQAKNGKIIPINEGPDGIFDKIGI